MTCCLCLRCLLCLPSSDRGWRMSTCIGCETQKFSSESRLSICMAVVNCGQLCKSPLLVRNRLRAKHDVDALMRFEQEAAFGKFDHDEGNTLILKITVVVGNTPHVLWCHWRCGLHFWHAVQTPTRDL